MKKKLFLTLTFVGLIKFNSIFSTNGNGQPSVEDTPLVKECAQSLESLTELEKKRAAISQSTISDQEKETQIKAVQEEIDTITASIISKIKARTTGLSLFNFSTNNQHIVDIIKIKTKMDKSTIKSTIIQQLNGAITEASMEISMTMLKGAGIVATGIITAVTAGYVMYKKWSSKKDSKAIVQPHTQTIAH